MNDRQRFLATMNYQARDRAPICDFGFWPETIDQWHKEGLPAGVGMYIQLPPGGNGITTEKFFGMDYYGWGPCADDFLRPAFAPTFEPKVIEDRGDHELVQQRDGVIVLRKKYMSSIPTHERHLLVDRQSWREHYKWRLDPATPDRYPDFAKARQIWQNPDHPNPRTCSGGSLYGWLRDWMGLENLSLVVYDDPAWFEEMVTTLADCTLGVMTRLFENGAQFDAVVFWEDMCYRGGPLLSPQHFRQFLMPHYRRIMDLAHAHGCQLAWVDCDGCIDELLPLWLECGVNIMFPIEVGTWRADPVAYRGKYGKELRMMGGFDKTILKQGPEAILGEVRRLTPLVEEGGYIGFCDHRVPPDVPLKSYLYYLRTVREMWGKGINLKPLHACVSAAEPA